MTRIALLPSAYPPSVGGVEELSRQLALTLRDAGDVRALVVHLPRARRPPEISPPCATVNVSPRRARAIFR